MFLLFHLIVYYLSSRVCETSWLKVSGEKWMDVNQISVIFWKLCRILLRDRNSFCIRIDSNFWKSSSWWIRGWSKYSIQHYLDKKWTFIHLTRYFLTNLFLKLIEKFTIIYCYEILIENLAVIDYYIWEFDLFGKPQHYKKKNEFI